MRGSIPGSQKSFYMCRFVIPYQKELYRGIIASEVAERMVLGGVIVCPQPPLPHISLCCSMLWDGLTALLWCKSSCVKLSFPCLAANG